MSMQTTTHANQTDAFWQTLVPVRPHRAPQTDPIHSDALNTEMGNDDVSASITQTWTDQAIKCWITRADCKNCSIPRGNYSFTCQMNKVVPVLLNTLGKPDNHHIKKLLPYLSSY